tara:strand:- start:7 stop:597 length:591 start_codon:yes stop_codon:yes gene_type:complete
MADRNLEAFNTRLNETLEDSKDIRISSSTIRAVRPRSIQKSIFGEGRVITMKYLNPIEKETLPYFHIFPTIITLNVQPEHITGINLFYLPRRFRKYIVNLYKRRMTNTPEFPRSLMYYDLVKKLRIPRSIMKPAIKKYSFVRAGAVAIEYDSSLWEEIYFGDTADFLEKQWRKSSRNIVYRNAIIEIISSLIDSKT